VGEDDDGRSVRVRLGHFLSYCEADAQVISYHVTDMQ